MMLEFPASLLIYPVFCSNDLLNPSLQSCKWSGRVENLPGDWPTDRGGFRSRSSGLPASLVIRSLLLISYQTETSARAGFSSFPMQYHWYILKLVNGLCAEFACLPVVPASTLTWWSGTGELPDHPLRTGFSWSFVLGCSGARLDRNRLQIWWSSIAWPDSELP